ncbi:MAG: hypothetical protein WKG07_49160 [Hymenobacter sp.]
MKYDWCTTEGLKAEGAYTTMRGAPTRPRPPHRAGGIQHVRVGYRQALAVGHLGAPPATSITAGTASRTTAATGKPAACCASQPIHDDVAKRDLGADRTRYKIRNLWTSRAAGTTAKPFRAEVPGHDVVMIRLSK